MDYKQHKGNLRGQIKNQVERKLYNKRIRAEAINVGTSDGQLTIPAISVSKRPFCLSCEHWKKQVGNVYCQNCNDNSEYQKANER
jgi:hypothetical protein